jgi:general secretion pathway protein K
MRSVQRGAAILTAMLTVTLVATFAATALWQQWRNVEVESAERTRTQMAWVLTGALDWARLILREDGRTSQVDHLSEPWALPLSEARLSSFLAVDKNNTDDTMEAFLSGQITDLQGLLNVTNLVQDGKPSPADIKVFGRLFKALNLPPAQLDTLVDSLISAGSPSAGAAGTTGSMSPGQFMPTRFDQLAWLGVPDTTLQALAPYVTLLPARTTLNLNTAPVPVLVAALPGLDAGQAQQMVARRALAHYETVAEGLKATGISTEKIDSAPFGVATRYFVVRGQLRIGDTTVQEMSLIERQGTDVKVLWRKRESLQ